MGLFGGSSMRTGGGFKFDLTTTIILVLLTLIIVQAIGIIFSTTSWGTNIKLGPVFVLIAISMSAATSIAILKKLMNNQMVDKKDIFAIVIVALLAVIVLFFLKEMVPEIFTQSLVQLQSMVGF